MSVYSFIREINSSHLSLFIPSQPYSPCMRFPGRPGSIPISINISSPIDIDVTNINRHHRASSSTSSVSTPTSAK